MTDKVLIVDDSLTVRMDLQEGFEAAGFEVQACSTAAAATLAFQRRPLQVVVLDVLLPDGDGVELLSALRASPQQAGAVVLMLSTEAEVAHRIRGLRTGADDYVGKPYDRHALVARAQELLRQRQGSRHSDVASVLVIDDSPTFREALAYALEEEGYAVLTADSGEEGLRLAAASRPSAMIVDSVLPGVDGTTVIRRIRLDAALRDMPCLLLTAAESHDAELNALEAGADAFVRKDETLNLILARLAAVLRSAAASAAGSAGDGAAAAQTTKRVLVVDDSTTYRHELAAALHAEGYDAVPAQSGEEALDLLAVQPVDCILMDLVMPGLGGQETCRRIKAAPGVRDIPLIMLTAHDGGNAMIDSLGAGADDFIQKSVDFVVLLARVRAQIRRKQFEDENRRIREELLHERHEAASARAARELAETRAALVDELERKSRELERATQAKSLFLATMSHEIRTPLNAIIGMAGLLADAPLSSEHHEFASIIRTSGDHLLTVINDILDFSRLESGKLPLESVPFEVTSLVEECLDLVTGKAREKDIELTYEVSGNVPATLLADAGRVRQILANFLSNAVKFTGSGEVVVSVSSMPLDNGTGLKVDDAGAAIPKSAAGTVELHFAVRDTGIGIPQDRFDRLFQSFSQVDTSIQREYGGTGLGLAICKRLAELMGGRVWAESRTGHGSTFHVCVLAELPAGDVAPRPPRGQAVPLSGLRAWVIDDNHTNRRILCRQLRDWGLAVQDSGEPGDALDWAIRGDAAELAVLDFHMPGLNGLQLAQSLNKIRGTELKQVLLTSGFPLPDVEARAAGLLAQLSKPVKHAALLNTILRLFERQPASAPAKPAAPVPASPAAPLRILIAEDNPINAQLMIFVLGNLMGHRTEVAGNGVEAIEALRRQPFDVILMDVQMPVMDGLEATRQIHREWPAATRPRIIALTAGVMSEEEQACRAAGMDDFLVKPLDRVRLEAALAHCGRVG